MPPDWIAWQPAVADLLNAAIDKRLPVDELAGRIAWGGSVIPVAESPYLTTPYLRNKAMLSPTDARASMSRGTGPP